MKKRTVPVTDSQVKMIHTLKAILGVNDRDYRALLGEMFGVDTSKALVFEQAQYIIDVLKASAIRRGLWTEKKERFNRFQNRPGMATPAQLRMIEAIWSEVYPKPDQKAGEAALRSYLFRFFGVSDIRFLNSETVVKVLYALKQMQARKVRKNGAETQGKHKTVGMDG